MKMPDIEALLRAPEPVESTPPTRYPGDSPGPAPEERQLSLCRAGFGLEPCRPTRAGRGRGQRARGLRLQPGLFDVQVRGGGFREEPGAAARVREDSLVVLEILRALRGHRLDGSRKRLRRNSEMVEPRLAVADDQSGLDARGGRRRSERRAHVVLGI